MHYRSGICRYVMHASVIAIACKHRRLDIQVSQHTSTLVSIWLQDAQGSVLSGLSACRALDEQSSLDAP